MRVATRTIEHTFDQHYADPVTALTRAQTSIDENKKEGWHVSSVDIKTNPDHTSVLVKFYRTISVNVYP